MDQRPYPTAVFSGIFISIFIASAFTVLVASAQEKPIIEQPGEIVEASPIDVFSQRSGLWNSEKLVSDKKYLDVSSPYETLSKTPGVQARFEGSPTISIRGSQSLPRVLGLYNSIPLNTADGLGANRILIPHETVGEMRLFKGPASLFFGGDAMGGAVNFLSRKIDRPLARGHIGSFGQRGLLLGAPLVSNKRHQNQITTFTEHVDGNYPYVLKSTGEGGTRSNNNRALQRHTYFGQNNFDRWTLSQNLIWAQEIAATPGSIPSPGATQARSSSGLASVQAGFRLTDATEFNYRAFGILSDNEYRFGTSESFSKTSRVGNSLSWKQNWQGAANLSSELFVDHNHDESKSTFTGERFYVANDTETGLLFDIPIWGTLLLKPGTRYLWAHRRAVHAIGVFEELENFSRWVTYSEGFRSPSLSQRFANFGTSLANPELKPESSDQIEIGFKQNGTFTPETYWDQYRYGASVFRINYKDYISTQSLAGGYTQPVNIGFASGFGFETQGGLDINLWSFDAAYSYLQTEDSQKQKLPLSPEHQASATAGYRWSAVVTSLTATYWSKFFDRYGTGLIEMGSWNTFDLNFKTVDLSDWAVKAGVLNLLDTPVEQTSGYPEPQRRLYLSVERLF